MTDSTPRSDPAAVQADDALLDELATARMADDTEETFRLLAAWRRDVHTDSERALVDTDTAMAAIHAGLRRADALRVAAVVGAVLVIVGSAIGLASYPARPGDVLYRVRVALYGDYVPPAPDGDRQ